MEEQIKSAMKFYMLATELKYKLRSGWDEKHWDIQSDRLESIAEHVYGTCILAISLNSQFNLNLDMEKVLKTLVIHEIGEVLIGDITPFDKTPIKEKEEIEHKAMQEILKNLYDKDEYYKLLIEFDERKTKEAEFAYLCDKLEADIQAKVYQEKGCQKSLEDQENNVVFKNYKVQKMVKEGAKTAFDIWYEYDKDKYKDNEVFKKTLKYIKNNSLH